MPPPASPLLGTALLSPPGLQSHRTHTHIHSPAHAVPSPGPRPGLLTPPEGSAQTSPGGLDKSVFPKLSAPEDPSVSAGATARGPENLGVRRGHRLPPDPTPGTVPSCHRAGVSHHKAMGGPWSGGAGGEGSQRLRGPVTRSPGGYQDNPPQSNPGSPPSSSASEQIRCWGPTSGNGVSAALLSRAAGQTAQTEAETADLHFSQLWRRDVQDPGAAGSVSGGSSPPGSPAAADALLFPLVPLRGPHFVT